MRYALPLALAPILFLSACSAGDDFIGLPATGTLEVTTSTTGSQLDPDGYTFQIDGGPNNLIGPSGTVRSDLPAGSHSIQLTGLADNCFVGDNPRSVTISGGQTIRETFAIACSASTGSLAITTATTGLDPDTDGYTVVVDGGMALAMGPNSNLEVPNTTVGVHAVQLSGIATNCALQGANPRSATVTPETTVEVRFAVACSNRSSPLVWRHLDTGTGYILQGIWGTSASDLFVLGETSDGSSTSGILHFDGQRWTEQLTVPNQRLHGLWGSSPTDVFAVGFNAIGAGPGGLIYHYDGSSWTQMEDPALNEPLYASVWGTGPSDVYAVGEYFHIRDSLLISHFDGSTWSQPLLETEGVATDVFGTAADNVYVTAYGHFSDSYAVLRYDGSTWTPMSSADDPGILYGVWASSPDDVFAVGWKQSGGFIIHYDGRVWSRMEVPATLVQLLDVWGTSGSDVYAVGDGTILHYDGRLWSQVSQEGGFRVFGFSATDVYVVGGNGAVLHGSP